MRSRVNTGAVKGMSTYRPIKVGLLKQKEGQPCTSLIPITSPAGWLGKPIYENLIERLVRLELVLIGLGVARAVPRLQYHLATLRRLQEHNAVDSDETLWSLLEATELADISNTLALCPPGLFRQKFRAILNGPVHPQQETVESNLARNTLFELHLAGWLMYNSVPTRLCHNPDIRCTMPDRDVFIQCKRPFSLRGVRTAVTHACKQLSRDLDAAGNPAHRGVVGISLTRALNPTNAHVHVQREEDLTPALMSQVRRIAEHNVTRYITGPRIIA